MYRQLLIIIFLLFFFDCKSAHKSAMSRANESAMLETNAVDMEISNNAKSNRLIIYNARIKLEDDNPEEISKEIAAIAKKYDGYIVSTSNHRVVMRIVYLKLNDTIKAIEKISQVTEKNIESDDVTEYFLDTKLRLENKIKARERYLELLKKSEDVKAALAVEKELERLNVEIESYQGKIKRMSHLIENSTITIYIKKKVRPGPIGYIFWGLYKGIKWLFVWD